MIIRIQTKNKIYYCENDDYGIKENMLCLTAYLKEVESFLH